MQKNLKSRLIHRLTTIGDFLQRGSQLEDPRVRFLASTAKPFAVLDDWKGRQGCDDEHDRGRDAPELVA
jgi:hypothetical protein